MKKYDTFRKSLYNLRYKIKQMDKTNEFANKKLSDFKSKKQLNIYKNQLELELEQARINALYKKDERKALLRDLDFTPKNSKKHYELKKAYLQKYEPYEYKKQQKRLENQINKYDKLETKAKKTTRTNKWGLTLTKEEIKEFYKQRDKANKKKAKILKQLEKDNPVLYDYIMGKTATTGDFNPTRDGRFYKSNIIFKDLFNKKFYDTFMGNFKKINSKEFTAETYYNEDRERLLSIFKNDRWRNLPQDIQNEFFKKAKTVPIPVFMAWYTNNKSKMNDYYLEGKYEMVGYSKDDLIEELNNVINELDKYNKKIMSNY